MNPLLRVLWVGTPAPDLSTSAFGPFELQACASLGEAARSLSAAPSDALVLQLDAPGHLQELLDWPSLTHAVLDAAVLVLSPGIVPAMYAKLIHRGVQDVMPAADADGATIARALRLSVERKRLERSARKAYATDLGTGLPSHSQLLEHMTHLLALREREPAPMALLVLRIEGLATTRADLGAEAANVLRRKVAVRLRAGLRASDVVAAIGADSFAVLLAWIDAPADALRVAGKLEQALRQTFPIAGQDRSVALSVGVSQYPEHGRLAEELLRRAIGQASAGAAAGREGFANRVERGAAPAANDES